MTYIEKVTDYIHKEWGLDTTLAYKIVILLIWAYYAGMPVRIVSGWRDPARQKALRERWDAGDRAGLATRPAIVSKHSHTDISGNPDALAVDISAGSDQNLQTLGFWAKKYLGMRWGGDFRRYDPVHFYI